GTERWRRSSALRRPTTPRWRSRWCSRSPMAGSAARRQRPLPHASSVTRSADPVDEGASRLLRIRSPMLLERERELDALSRALADTRGGTGSVVLIEGAAGIGKSRLLDAACDRALTERGEVLRGRGVELERDVPFGVARSVFGD